MKFYQFLKSVQEGVGDGCVVYAKPWLFMGSINGMDIRILWNDCGGDQLTYAFVLPEGSIENEGFLEHFSKYTIEKARREYRMAEVGED